MGIKYIQPCYLRHQSDDPVLKSIPPYTCSWYALSFRAFSEIGRRLVRSSGGRSVLSNDPPSVNNTGDPTKNRQENVDEEVGAAASLEEDGKWRQE